MKLTRAVAYLRGATQRFRRYWPRRREPRMRELVIRELANIRELKQVVAKAKEVAATSPNAPARRKCSGVGLVPREGTAYRECPVCGKFAGNRGLTKMHYTSVVRR